MQDLELEKVVQLELPDRPFDHLHQADEHSRTRQKMILANIEVKATPEIKRIFGIREQSQKESRPLYELTTTYLDFGINRLLSDVGGLFFLVGYTPESGRPMGMRSEQEKAQDRLKDIARQLTGETLPSVTLELIGFCREHNIPHTNIDAVFDHFGRIDEPFPDGLKYSLLKQEKTGEFLGRTWGEIAEVLVLLSASKQEGDWQCYLTAQEEAEKISQAINKVASQSPDLPSFIRGAFGVLADLTEEKATEFSQLISSALPSHLQDTQKVLSLLASGVKATLGPSETVAGAVAETKKEYICLSNLANPESTVNLIKALSGRQSEDTVYYIDENHMDELRLRSAEYNLRFKREPLFLIVEEMGIRKAKWPRVAREITEASLLESQVKVRLSQMRIANETFGNLARIMSNRLDIWQEAVKSGQATPLSLEEFLNYHWDTLVFLSNVAGHTPDSARAMEEIGKFIKGEGKVEEETLETARKNIVRMAALFDPSRFRIGQKAPLLKNAHDVLIGMADSLEEIKQAKKST